MQYKVGMFGGNFNPLHNGHVQIITRAASMCQLLYVVVSHSPHRESIALKTRLRWLRETFAHLPNIRYLVIEDEAADKATYDWKADRDKIIAQIAQPLDVVFCGDDYADTGIYENLYPEAKIIAVKRDNISSTLIRGNPTKYFDMMPKAVQRYFVKKVLIVGAESSGKSVLVHNLALAFNTNYVEEYGRVVCERVGGVENMDYGDYKQIMLQHTLNEMLAINQSNRYLFIDTDVYTTMWFATKNNYDLSALALSLKNTYDYTFFVISDEDFVQDGYRYDKRYTEELLRLYPQAVIVRGDYATVFSTIVDTLV